MDQASLVDKDITSGGELVGLLRRAKGLRVEAGFWWREIGDDWRLVVATPLVHERGRLAAHQKIREALGPKAEEFEGLLDRLDVVSPSEGIITVLDIDSLGQVPLNRRVVREGIRGVYVYGAYFYFFAPRSFAHA